MKNGMWRVFCQIKEFRKIEFHNPLKIITLFMKLCAVCLSL